MKQGNNKENKRVYYSEWNASSALARVELHAAISLQTVAFCQTR